MRQVRSRPVRRGFTLVELLVAAAVSLVLMVIITEAFKRGVDMFRTLRAQGQLQERLRLGILALRDDLASYHFEPADGSSRGYYVHQQDLTSPNWTPPSDGFFRIFQAPEALNPPNPSTNPLGLPCIFEGTDRENLLYTRASTHVLHFTVFRRETSPVIYTAADPSYLFRVAERERPVMDSNGVQRFFPRDYVEPQDFRQVDVFGSRWAEVAYFMLPNGNSANGTPLFNLYRRTRAAIPREYKGRRTLTNLADNTVPPGPVPAIPENPEISARLQQTGQRFYNRSTELTQPRFRMCMGHTDQINSPHAAGIPVRDQYKNVSNPPIVPPLHYTPLAGDNTLTDPIRRGDDILLSDVVSFEVKAFWEAPAGGPQPQQQYLVPPLGGPLPNPDFPFDYIPLSTNNRVLGNQGLRVFDTWSRDGIYGTMVGPPGSQQPIWSFTGAFGHPNETAARIPLRIRVKSVLIRIRIWDIKVEQTRQITIIQDL